MKPIIPKVHVGDILLGTKNLRNWLQTASIFRYLTVLKNGIPWDAGIVKNYNIYTPSKDDKFVVAVNIGNSFLVWQIGQNITILFVNGKSKTMTKPNILAPPEPEFKILEQTQHVNKKFSAKMKMDPSIFSKWFIRTEGKRPDLLNSWPDYAYQFWGSLQMNGVSNRENPIRVRVTNLIDFPFTTHLDNTQPKTFIREQVKDTIKKGIIRGSNDKNTYVNGRGPYGPSLDDIHRLRRQIHEIMNNSRVAKKLETDVGFRLPSSILKILHKVKINLNN